MLLPGIKGLKYFCLRFQVFYEYEAFPCQKIPWSRKNFSLWKTSLIVESFSGEKIIWSRKNLCLWKTSLILENVLDNEKYVSGKKKYWKLLWLWRNTCLWKASLIMEISLVLEHFFNPGKVFACVKLLCLWKKIIVEVFWK